MSDESKREHESVAENPPYNEVVTKADKGDTSPLNFKEEVLFDWLDKGLLNGLGLFLIGAAFGGWLTVSILVNYTDVTWMEAVTVNQNFLVQFLVIAITIGLASLAYNTGYMTGAESNGGDSA